ncbi:MAG: protease complex subunit PrcB family protein [Candidatus Sericytochromatia bacterium]
MRHHHALALVLAAAFVAGGPAHGCGAERAAHYQALAPLEAEVIETGNWSQLTEPVERVIRTPEEWLAFYRSHAPAQPPPVVDFTRHMVVAVLLPRRTGGYAVTLDRLEETPDALIVHYTEERPGPDAVVIQALTQPHVFATVPRRDKPVQFAHQERLSGPP